MTRHTAVVGFRLLACALLALALLGCPPEGRLNPFDPGSNPLKVALPYFSLADGSYDTAQLLTIACNTLDVSIYYTTDETDPDETSILYSGTVTISSSVTLKAVATKSGLENSDIVTVVITITALPPAVPTDLVATAGDGSVGLSWSTVADADAYHVYYAAGSTASTASTHSGPHTATSATISGLTNGTQYAFVVTASNEGGASLPSAIVTATPVAGPLPASAPSVSVAGLTNDSTPTWTWTSGGGGNGTYRYKLDGADLSTGSTETTSTSYTPESPLVEGSHVLYVQERNAAEGWSQSGSASSLVDLTPPLSPNVSATTPTSDRTPTWSWTAGGGGNGTYRHRLDNSDLSAGATQTTSLAHTPGSDLALGNHTLYVQERDDAGNWSAAAFATVDVTLPRYYVSTSGSDSNTGDSPAAPKRNIQSAIDAADAALTSGEVLVAAGTYSEMVTMRAGISLKGGYSADFLTRDWDTLQSKISMTSIASGPSALVATDGTITSETVIEGMYVDVQLTGTTDDSRTDCIRLQNGASPDIRHNTLVMNNALSDSPSNDRDYACCIAIPDGSSYTYSMHIADNTMICVRTNANTASYMTAIGMWFRVLAGTSNVVVERNRLSVQGTTYMVAGVELEGVPGGVVIRSNYISVQNAGTRDTAGIWTPSSANCTFSNNTVIINGTTATSCGFALYAGPYQVYNNIVVGNGYGSAYADSGMSSTTTIDYNLQFRFVTNTVGGATDGGHNMVYDMTNPFTAGVFVSGSLDTNVADGDSTNIHLVDAGNYAVNKGTDTSSTALGGVTDDIDGESRPKGGAFDVGADEK